MIINHNISAMNTHRQLSMGSASASKSMEKLSSGYRINRAGDDAAGLSISEKMRAQIKGLGQASRNSQDGISMIQSAEGALSETHDILQRMRELATQAANDTNVNVDKEAIQSEINQLSSEINRIGNTTEFNTQKLLKGDGSVSVDKTNLFTGANLSGGKTSHVDASVTFAVTAEGSDVLALGTLSVTLNGRTLTLSAASGTTTNATGTVGNVTATGATVYMGSGQTSAQITTALSNAFNQIILNSSDLVGNYTASGSAENLTIKAVAGGAFEGAQGNIAAVTATGYAADTAANIGTTTQVQATGTFSLATATMGDILSEGLSINGKQIEFYDANAGQYTGEAIGVNVAGAIDVTSIVSAVVEQVGTKIDGVTLSQVDAGITGQELIVTANVGGTAGNSISVADGGIQVDFTSKFQVGANEGQSFQMNISDMRARALGVTANAGTEGFGSSAAVTDGTSNINKEASLDVSTHATASSALTTINNAIEKVSAQRSKLGAYQNRLEHTIKNLDTSAENLQASESRIRDVDMAKEMMQFSKNNILTQAAQSMLAQANQAPQGVLQLLR